MSSGVQHEARLAEAPVELPTARRPEPGPITILPRERTEDYRGAVEGAGGRLVPLGPQTRGLVSVSYRDVDPLVAALDAHPGIGWVQLPFAGIDNAAARLAPAARRGVVFTSAKGAYAQPVAEHALLLTLAALRILPVRIRASAWGPAAGLSLYGRRVLVLGAGGIAREYLDLLRPFGVRTTVVRRSAGEVPGAERTVPFAQFRAELPHADVVLLAAAATPETRGVVDAAALAAMKPSAVLVNVARGPLVDTEALLRALDEGLIHGAGLDVTDPEPLPDGHPLFSHERAVVTPHTADTPEMVVPLQRVRIAANVEAFLRTGRFVGLADPLRGY